MNTTYVAFLRAINVGGRAVIKMTDLKQAFVQAGCKNVHTYIQSGNVVFDCDSEKSEAQFVRISRAVGNLLEVTPGIAFRTLVELEKIIASKPFERVSAGSDVKLYAALLTGPPSARPKFPLILPKEALEAFSIAERDVFIVSRRKPTGMFGFPNNFVEQELGTPATTRNWNTITKVVEFARRIKK